MFCLACGAAIVEHAQFCAKCGSPQTKPDLNERREFLIPIPSDSPFNTPFPQDGDRFLTFQQLKILGVNRPAAGDYLLFRGFTHLWKHFSKYVKSRVEELEHEGWELDEPFDPKSDSYGILTNDAIKHRFSVEEVSMPAQGLFARRKPGVIIKGFRVKMKRPAVGDKDTIT